MYGKPEAFLCESTLNVIQNKMDLIEVPAHVGRLPDKISSSFSGFTAEQWMIWTIVYSPFVLRDFLPSEHFDMWCTFSNFCSILCRPFIHETEVAVADHLVLEFCHKFEQLFGEACVTPNMHLHAHLCKCVEDFGPVYSFWCFSFERYNGILESFQKSWHAPEIQVLEKFTLMQSLSVTNVSQLTPPELLPCISSVTNNYAIIDDRNEIFDSKSYFDYEKNLFCSPATVTANLQDCHHTIPPFREKYFTESLRNKLKDTYCRLYMGQSVIQHVPMKYTEFYQVKVYGHWYTSLRSRSHKSTCIMAIWPNCIGKIISHDHNCLSEDVRTGLIEYFVLHNPTIDGIDDETFNFAKVKWYDDHPRKFWFKNSVVVSSTLFIEESEASFLPLSRIMSNCAIVEQSTQFDYGIDKVNVCIPLVRRID